MSRDINIPITIADIDIPDSRRNIDAASVKRLAESIDKIGLRHPITVREKGDRYILVAGRHRIEAFKRLKREHIQAVIVRMTNDEARLWEIAENLHRAELTKLERDEQVAEWIKITEKLAQTAPVSGGRGNEGGIRAAARSLGIDRDDARRAVKVASMSQEAKDAAHEAGIDDNRTALLKVAAETTPEAQVAKISELAVAKIRKPVPIPSRAELDAQDRAALIRIWRECSPAVRTWFMKVVADETRASA